MQDLIKKDLLNKADLYTNYQEEDDGAEPGGIETSDDMDEVYCDDEIFTESEDLGMIEELGGYGGSMDDY